MVTEVNNISSMPLPKREQVKLVKNGAEMEQQQKTDQVKPSVNNTHIQTPQKALEKPSHDEKALKHSIKTKTVEGIVIIEIQDKDGEKIIEQPSPELVEQYKERRDEMTSVNLRQEV